MKTVYITHINIWIKIGIEINMKTIQMTLDENLLDNVDKAIKKMKTTRSAFIRKSLHKSLIDLKMEEMEEQQRQGYLKKPVKKDEFDVWENEQEWV